ncbi:MAG TPA: response regulator [Phycisphaerales bacterium]|nr:response regulator [Phycisphaerales bacterium]
MRVMFVDDDLKALEALRRMLFGRRDIWQMRYVADPNAALESLRSEPADLVISDLQMPEMDGMVFLDQVREHFPQTIRYVLTGVMDHPSLARALRCAHHVIAKPCRPPELHEVMQRAEAIMQRMNKLKKASLLAGMDRLPVMPRIHQQALEMLDSPMVSLRRLGRLLAGDAGMAARVLQLANSAYVGRSGAVHDPVQAAVLLGIKTVKAMILTDGLFARLNPHLIKLFGVTELQSHCIRVGALARRICTDLNFGAEKIEAAATAGMLHDAGKIIMLSQQKDVFLRAMERSRKEGRPLFETEQDLMGINHAELVGAMLQLWVMPAEIIEAAACHHQPLDATSILSASHTPTLADVIHLADAIDHRFCSSGVDGTSPEMDQQRLRFFNLAEHIPRWIQQHMQIQNRKTVYDCQYV